MKTKITFLMLAFILSFASFAGKKCIYYYKSSVTSDQKIIDYLKANGYDVTIAVWSGELPADYDLAVLSETNGSGDEIFKTAFKTAPIPVVIMKTWAIRSTSMAWLATNSSATDFNNTPDVSAKIVAPTHPIAAGMPLDVTFVEQQSPALGAATQWANFPTLPSGATIIATVTSGGVASVTVTGPLAQTIAFEKNTTLNTSTLQNRAVLLGLSIGGCPFLTDYGLKFVKQACDWVSEVKSSVAKIDLKELLWKSENKLVNPASLNVAIYNTNGSRILISNESEIYIGNLDNGVYLAKTKQGNLKFIK